MKKKNLLTNLGQKDFLSPALTQCYRHEVICCKSEKYNGDNVQEFPAQQNQEFH